MTTSTARLTNLIVALMLLFTACSASTEPVVDAIATSIDESTGDQAQNSPANDPSDDEALRAELPDTVAPDETAASGEATSPTPEPTASPAPPVGPVLLTGLDEIELLTPINGGGTRPLLSWTPVTDADVYSLVVYAPDGQLYWGSLLTETETYVGGPIQIDETKPGPRVLSDMSWSVVALDVDFQPIASSPIRPIAP